MQLDTEVQVHEQLWSWCWHTMEELQNERGLSFISHTALVALAVKHTKILLFCSQCTHARIHSVVLCTLQSDSWTQVHSVVKRWLLCGRSPPENTSQLSGTVPGNSTRPIHNHVPSTYCIPECMSIVQCYSHPYTFHISIQCSTHELIKKWYMTWHLNIEETM